jgi:hypothetical protein
MIHWCSVYFGGGRQPCLDGPKNDDVIPAFEPGPNAGDGVHRVPTMDPGSEAGMTSEIRSGGMQNYSTACSCQTVRCPVQSGASRSLAPFAVPGRSSEIRPETSGLDPGIYGSPASGAKRKWARRCRARYEAVFMGSLVSLNAVRYYFEIALVGTPVGDISPTGRLRPPAEIRSDPANPERDEILGVNPGARVALVRPRASARGGGRP